MQKVARKLRTVANPAEWTAAESAELYGVRNWGAGYFDIDETGNVTVSVPANGKRVTVSLMDMIAGMQDGSIRCIAVDTPVPSAFSHEILNANPYAYLDDAPLEERRARVGAGRVREPRMLEWQEHADIAAGKVLDHLFHLGLAVSFPASFALLHRLTPRVRAAGSASSSRTRPRLSPRPRFRAVRAGSISPAP